MCSAGMQNPIMYMVEAIIWQFMIQGLLQPVVALLVAVFALPVAAAATALCKSVTVYVMYALP